jgi:hypothetical protein
MPVCRKTAVQNRPLAIEKAAAASRLAESSVNCAVAATDCTREIEEHWVWDIFRLFGPNRCLFAPENGTSPALWLAAPQPAHPPHPPEALTDAIPLRRLLLQCELASATLVAERLCAGASILKNAPATRPGSE